jgi:membrane-associated phospholipid phosphatase
MPEFARMRLWETASVMFFVYVLLAAPLAGRAGRLRFVKVLAGGVAGLVITLLISRVDYTTILHDWVAPPALLLLAYWVSGWLFAAPRHGQERVLLDLDLRLHVPELARRTPRFLAEILELSYVGVYPLIPMALLLHLFLTPDPDPERFWAVLLITDYTCFGVLAWVQTRPPRLLENAEPWRSSVRPFNLRLLGASSIQANTFPSGHAAEALASALLVLGAPWPVVTWMFVNAAAISAAAVLGRYHYAADALAGWLVALAVWAATW